MGLASRRRSSQPAWGGGAHGPGRALDDGRLNTGAEWRARDVPNWTLGCRGLEMGAMHFLTRNNCGFLCKFSRRFAELETLIHVQKRGTRR